MKSQRIYPNLLLMFVLVLLISGLVFAQTTGKIAGKVIDKETGEPLVGANVQIEGTSMGSAASMEGDYFIINIPPGTYTVKAQYMGYAPMSVTNLKVNVNRTTFQDFKLSMQVLEGQEVVVEAEKVAIKKDQTSSVRNVSSEQMDILPVESVGAVVSLQAGVVNGHFRGGRSGEVNYLIDGMQVTDAYSGGSIGVEADAVEEVEVIKGTFNAEYGRAMSGIVNQVTKDGGNDYHGFIKGYLGNYYTSNNDIFIGLDPLEVTRRQDYQFQLSGPVLTDKVNFLVNYRHQNNKNQYVGFNLFEIDDFSDFSSTDPAMWTSQKSGDSSEVNMGWSINNSLNLKLSSRITNDFKVSLLYIYNDYEGQGYSHSRKYHPDGRSTGYSNSHLVNFKINHMLSAKMFYELNAKYTDKYNGSYVYENALNPGYISNYYNGNSGAAGFSTGGQDKGHYERFTNELQIKGDMTWQLHKNHAIKAGFDFLETTVDVQSKSILNWYEVYDPQYADTHPEDFQPFVAGDSSLSADMYKKSPIDFSAYLQDKMEFEEMVLNIGIRYDYYDPMTTYPSNRRNPTNSISGLPVSEYLDAPSQYQISPRLGLSYQLGDQALLHFSYGHFFQRPNYSDFYQNNALLISNSNFDTKQGNPLLKAEKTVQYEIGLYQQLMRGMGVEVSLFYRDIYNLRTFDVVYTYDQRIYGLYTNLDYGNAKGLEITYDYESGPIYANANYTLQYTRGNADNPSTTFDRAGGNMDPIPRLIPMSWDQRHTFNVSVGYQKTKYNVALTGRYGSGSPYTFSPLPESILSNVLLYPNNAQKPSTYSFDLNAYYNFDIGNGLKAQLQLYVYNLLDTLNENGVYGRTGRAYTNILLDNQRNNFHNDWTTIEDQMHNPTMYSSPRMVKLGLGIMF